jgi:hypothetical protein
MEIEKGLLREHLLCLQNLERQIGGQDTTDNLRSNICHPAVSSCYGARATLIRFRTYACFYALVKRLSLLHVGSTHCLMNLVKLPVHIKMEKIGASEGFP